MKARLAITPRIALTTIPLTLLALSGCSAAAAPTTPADFITGTWVCDEVHPGEEQYNRSLQFDVTADHIVLTQQDVNDESSEYISEYDYTVQGTTLTTTPTDGGSGWTIELPEEALFDDANVVEITEGWTQIFEVTATADTAEWSMEPSADFTCQRTEAGEAATQEAEPADEPAASGGSIEVGEPYDPNSADFIPVPASVGDYRLVNQALIEEEGLVCSSSDLFQIEQYGRGSKSTYLYANADGVEELRARSSDSNCRQIGGQKLGFLEFGFANFGNEEDGQATIYNGKEPNIDGTDIRCGEADMSAMIGNAGIAQTCALARGTAGATVSELRGQDDGDGIDRDHLAELLTAWAGAIPRLQG